MRSFAVGTGAMAVSLLVDMVGWDHGVVNSVSRFVTVNASEQMALSCREKTSGTYGGIQSWSGHSTNPSIKNEESRGLL